MFFILSKTLGVLTTPSKLIAILALAGAILMLMRWRRCGRILLIASVVLVVLLGLLPTGTALLLVLEQRFPPWAGSGESPAGIIVLGGAIDPDRSAARHRISLNASAERVTEIAALARRFPDARIVFTGGNADLVLQGPPEASFVLGLFESFGIPKSRVTIEERSRNTVENAHFTKALINPKPGERWLLVTSAAHMPRAIGVFRETGMAVEAYPVDWQTSGWSDLWRRVPWPLDGLHHADDAVKEWTGLVAYWLAGYSAELFPGPMPANRGAAGPAGTRP